VKAARAARAAKAARAARARAARARAARARAARARAGQAAAPVRPAETNRPAPRPAGCGQITRMVSVTENLWRIECGPRAFLVRTAPDGYATPVGRLPYSGVRGRLGAGKLARRPGLAIEGETGGNLADDRRDDYDPVCQRAGRVDDGRLHLDRSPVPR